MNHQRRINAPGPSELASIQPSARLRASDQDRLHAAEQLHEHAAAGRLTTDELEHRVEKTYGVTTIGELDELMQDLPGPRLLAGQRGSGPPRLKRWFAAIMGSSSRRVSFQLARRATSIAIMASPDIDLCAAELSSGQTVIYAFAFFGWPDIYVPDTVRVELEGFTLVGGDAERGSQRVPPADAPVVKLRSYGLIGGYTVWRLPPELHGVPYDQAREAARALPRSRG